MLIKQQCINLDWLEVHCLEPSLLNAAYYTAAGCNVKVREYGTPQYKEMFTIFDDAEYKLPMFEIRRSPYSLKDAGGIFDSNSVHIRLSNRLCYDVDPISLLRQFLDKHNYKLIGISRIDIALDVTRFSNDVDPGDFLHDYILERYFKLHLSTIAPRGAEVLGGNFSAHGKDGQFSRLYNSLKWGSPKSAISVKVYNKTLELFEVKDKFYIRDAWKAAGLTSPEDDTKRARIRDLRYYINQLTRNLRKANFERQKSMRDQISEYTIEMHNLQSELTQVWRVEFSLSSAVKGMVQGDNMDVSKSGKPTMYHFTLSSIETRQRLLFTFLSLASKYLHFKIPGETRNGTPLRKDRCQSYYPISIDALQVPYKPMRLTSQVAPSRMDVIIINRLRSLLDDDSTHLSNDESLGIQKILTWFAYHKRLEELNGALANMEMRDILDVTRQSADWHAIIEQRERDVYNMIDHLFVNVNEVED